MSSEDNSQRRGTEQETVQGRPGGQAAVGERASPTDVLSRPAGLAVVKDSVVLFAVVAAAVGFGGMLTTELLSDNLFASGASGTSYNVLVFAGGPLLAAVLGLQGAFDVGRTTTESAVLGFASGAAGHVALTLVGGLFVAITADTFEFGDALVAGILMAIGTGLVASGVVWADS